MVDTDTQGSDLQSVVRSLTKGEFIYIHPVAEFHLGEGSHLKRSANFARYSHINENRYFCYDGILSFDKKDFSGLEVWMPRSNFDEPEGFLPMAMELGEFFNGNELLYVGRDKVMGALEEHGHDYNVSLVQYLMDNLDYEMRS